MNRRPDQSNRMRDPGGSAVLASLVAVTVLGCIGMYILQGVNPGNQDFNTILLYDAIKIIKTNLLTVMGEAEATWATMQNNGTMSCLLNGTTCVAYTSLTGYPPALPAIAPPVQLWYVNLGGVTVPYYTNGGTNGFTLSGTPCTTYPGTGLNGCIIQVNLSWYTNCTITPCTTIILHANFTTSLSATQLNPNLTDGDLSM